MSCRRKLSWTRAIGAIGFTIDIELVTACVVLHDQPAQDESTARSDCTQTRLTIIPALAVAR